jgi:biotin carboxyl carrier protein
MEPVEVVVHAEHVDVPERLIVAPAAGVFRPQASVAAAGGTVEAGQTLGAIARIEGEVDVVSPHTGRLMGFLVLPGERVRDSQPLAWARTPDAPARPAGDRGNRA